MKKFILITGCSSGIGYTVANDLSKLNDYYIFASCRNHNDVDRLNQEYIDKNLYNKTIEAIQLNVRDIGSINNALDYILSRTGGKIDILFNNAGYGQPGAVEDLCYEAVKEQFDTNVFGLLELTNKVIPIMREQGCGKIIINSSILGFISLKYRGAYIASKHALEGFFNTLRLELSDTPISISSIQPGPVTSKFRDNAHIAFKKYLTEDKIEKSYHAENYKKLLQRFTADKNNKHKKDLFEQPGSSVTKRVIKIINSKHPRSKYSVTFPTYLFRILTKILPSNILDKILNKI